MPPVIAPIIAGVGAIASAIGMTTGSLLIGLLSIGGEIGLSLYQRATAKKDRPARQELQDNFAQDVPVFYQGLGLYKIGGQYLWREYADGAFYLGIILSGDLIDGIQAFYINGTECLIDAQGYVTTPPFNTVGGKLVQFEIRYGYVSQAKSGLLAYGFPSIITDNHRGPGVAYAVVRIVKDTDEQWQKVFNAQIPSITFLVRGALVYDPRDALQVASRSDTWKYSTNPALGTLHYSSAKTGYGLSRSVFAADTFTAVANHCDQLVPTKTKGNRKRYEYGGVLFADERPGDILENLLSTFSGRFYITRNGLVGLSCDDLETPVIRLTEAHVVSIDLERKVGALFDSTGIRCKFTSEDHGYAVNGEEADPYENAAARARVGREVPRQIDLPYVFRHDQARRLMKKRWFDLNPEWSPRVVFNCHGVELFGERVFSFSFGLPDGEGGRIELFDQTFRILSVNESPDKGLHEIEVTCVSISPEAAQWNYLAEEGTAPALAPATSQSVIPQTPTGLYARVGDVDPGAGTLIRAVVAWVASTAGHTQEAQFKLSSDTAWIDCPVDAADRAFPLPLTGYLTAGANYDFRVRVVNATYGASDWANLVFAATALAGTTGALQNFAAVNATLRIATSVTQSSEVTAGFVEVVAVASGAGLSWTGSSFKAAAQNQTVALNLTKPAGAYDVYARSVGVNGDFGPVSGPLAVTVTATPANTGSGGTGSGSGGSNGSGGNNNNSGNFGSSGNGGGIYGLGNTPGQVNSSELYGGGGDGSDSGGIY